MRTIVISCETIKGEFEYAARQIGCDYETIWLESGLHNTPAVLHKRLQGELDSIREADRVLLAFGDCGNSLIGLKTRDFELIKPLVDDCISLLLGSVKRRMEINSERGTYFLTEGWLLGERNIYTEYRQILDQYGEEVGREIHRMMLGNYERLMLLDTGSYDLDLAARETARIAGEMGFDWKVEPASVSYLAALLKGPWDDGRFLIVPPNSVIEASPYY